MDRARAEERQTEFDIQIVEDKCIRRSKGHTGYSVTAAIKLYRSHRQVKVKDDIVFTERMPNSAPQDKP